MKNQQKPKPFALSLIFLMAMWSMSTVYAQKKATEQIKVVDPFTGQVALADAHVVRQGETLYGISKKYRIEVQDLKDLNNLKSNLIHPGQRLAIAPPTSYLDQPIDNQAETDATKRLENPSTDHLIASASPLALYQYGYGKAERPFDWDAPLPNAPDYSYLNKRRGDVPSPVTRLDSESDLDDGRSEISATNTTRSNMRVRGADIPDANAETKSRSRRIYHQIKPGEDIYTIGEMYGVPPEQIREWNGRFAVVPGQTLIIHPIESPDPDIKKSQLDIQDQQSASRVRSARAQGYEYIAPESDREAEVPLFSSLDNLTEDVTTLDFLNPGALSPTPQPARGGTNTRIPEPTRRSITNPSSDMPAQLLNDGDEYSLGANVEYDIQYRKYEYAKARGKQFYALHKTLPLGSILKMPIPDNAGYISVEVVGKLAPSNKVDVALSPACTKLLGNDRGKVTFFYD